MLEYMVQSDEENAKTNARSIFERNQGCKDFISPKLLKKILQQNQGKKQEKIENDFYGPLSQPISEFAVLPENFQVSWIGNKNDI